MKVHPNLIPNTERSPEKLREMGRKGGLKSGEVRRKKKETLWKMKIIMEVLDRLESDEEARKKLEKLVDKRLKKSK